MSEIVGSIILLGATALLVAFAALHFSHLSAGKSSALDPRLEATAAPDADLRNLVLLHTGGEAFAPADLRVRVEATTGGALRQVYDGAPVAGAPLWKLGDRVTIPLTALSRAELEGARVEVTVVERAHGKGLATLALTLPRAGAAVNLTGFTLAGTVASTDPSRNPIVVRPGSTLTLYATVSHPAGRKQVSAVVANLSEIGGPTWVLLRDDGVLGDRRGGDGTWTAELPVPTRSTAGYANLTLQARDLEGRLTAPWRQRVYYNTTSSQSTIQRYYIYNGSGGSGGGAGGGSVGCNPGQACSLIAKIATGQSMAYVPPANLISSMRLSNFTWDKFNLQNVGNDQIILRVTDTQGNVWAATVYFDKNSGANGPSIYKLDVRYSNMWSTAASSTASCTATGGGGRGVTITSTTTLDLLNPTSPGRNTDVRFTCIDSANRATTTAGMYRYSGMGSGAVLQVAKIGNPTNEQNSVMINADMAFG